MSHSLPMGENCNERSNPLSFLFFHYNRVMMMVSISRASNLFFVNIEIILDIMLQIEFHTTISVREIIIMRFPKRFLAFSNRLKSHSHFKIICQETVLACIWWPVSCQMSQVQVFVCLCRLRDPSISKQALTFWTENWSQSRSAERLVFGITAQGWHQ